MENCSYCRRNNGIDTCSSCRDGYYRANNGTCIKNFCAYDENCSICIGKYCSKCIDGTSHNKELTKCIDMEKIKIEKGNEYSDKPEDKETKHHLNLILIFYIFSIL